MNKKTNYLIIGGGLSGLITAATLQRRGEDYLLVDSSPEWGGLARTETSGELTLDYGLKSIPLDSPLEVNALQLLKQKLELNFQIESMSAPTLVFEKNECREFMGFGETKNRRLAEELGYYTSSPRVFPSSGWGKLISELVALIPAERRLTQQQVTKFNLTMDEITEVVLNGDLKVEVSKVIFTPSPARIKDLVDPGSIPPRTQSRIGKTPPLTAISIDIVTEKGGPTFPGQPNVFVFRDSSDLDFYMVGQFVSNADTITRGTKYQTSHWLTFIDQEEFVDSEQVSKVLKTMKKLMRRAFPHVLETPVWERILVVPGAIGHFDQLQLEQNYTLPGIDNLFLCGAQLGGDARNLTNAIESSLHLAEILNPMAEAELEDESRSNIVTTL